MICQITIQHGDEPSIILNKRLRNPLPLVYMIITVHQEYEKLTEIMKDMLQKVYGTITSCYIEWIGLEPNIAAERFIKTKIITAVQQNIVLPTMHHSQFSVHPTSDINQFTHSIVGIPQTTVKTHAPVEQQRSISSSPELERIVDELIRRQLNSSCVPKIIPDSYKDKVKLINYISSTMGNPVNGDDVDKIVNLIKQRKNS